MFKRISSHPQLNKEPKISLFKVAIATALALVFSAVVLVPLIGGTHNSLIEIVAATIIAVILVTAVVMTATKERTVEQYMLFIFIIGVVLRLSFVLFNGSDDFQYDLWRPDGHFSYILQLASKFSLPTTNNDQYYHPPLHHFLAACIVRLGSQFGITSKYTLGLLVQHYTVLCSSLSALVMWRLLDELKIKSLPKLISFSVFCLHPIFILLGNYINNDCLSIFLSLLCFYFLVKWYNQTSSIFYISMTALTFGLAMMTKTATAITAVPIAFIFIYRFGKVVIARQVNNIKALIGRYSLFLLISVPLAFWYPIRNLLLFNQPFTYVLRLNDKTLYCDNVSLWNRFNPFDLDLFGKIFANTRGDYNVSGFILRSSLFGEYTISSSEIIARLLLFINLALIIISLVCMVYALIKNSRLRIINIALGLWWLAMMVSFVITNLQYPLGCTMDFRYIVPTLLIGTVFIGQTLSIIKSKPIKYGIISVSTLFCIFSTVFYCLQS